MVFGPVDPRIPRIQPLFPSQAPALDAIAKNVMRVAQDFFTSVQTAGEVAYNSSRLIESAKSGRIEELTAWASLPTLAAAKNAALLDVVSRAQDAMIPVLLRAGATLPGSKYKGYDQLAKAIEQNRPELLISLLKAGADPNGRNSIGKPLLYEAVSKGADIRILEALVEYGADINASLPDCGAALMIAAIRGNSSAMRLLLEKGADVHLVIESGVNKGATALMFAAERGDLAIVRMLLEKEAEAGINVHNAQRNLSALQLAIFNHPKNLPLIRLLLEYGAAHDPVVRQEAMTCVIAKIKLLKISKEEGRDLVKLLLEYSADPNVRDKDGQTCLEMAIQNCDATLMSLLLEYGADINAPDKDGKLPINLAVERNFFAGVKLLLEKGADPNSQDISGTPLLYYIADTKNSLEMMDLFLWYGANPNLKPRFHIQTLLSYCSVKEGGEEHIRLLLAYGADPYKIDRGYLNREEVYHLCIDICREQQIFVRNCFSEGIRNQAKKAALISAVSKQDARAVKGLLAQGVDFKEPILKDFIWGDVQYRAGDTAFTLAIESGNNSIIKMFQDRGADMAPVFNAAKEAYQKDPTKFKLYFSLALLMADKGAVQSLLDTGIDPNGPLDAQGENSLEIALAIQNVELVRLLIKAGAHPSFQSFKISVENSLWPIAEAIIPGLTFNPKNPVELEVFSKYLLKNTEADPQHLRVIEEEKLPVLPDVNINQLLPYVEALEITVSDIKPYYLENEGLSPQQRVVEGFNKLLNYIKNKSGYTAVPTDPIEREIFYNELQAKLQRILLYIQQNPLDTKIKPYLIALGAAGYACGSRWRDEIQEVYTDWCKPSASSSAFKSTLQQELYRLLGQYRLHIAQSLFQNVHELGTFMQRLGEKWQIPGYKGVKEDIHAYLQETADAKFKGVYSLENLFTHIVEAYTGNQYLREMMIDKLKDFAPKQSTENEALKQAYREDKTYKKLMGTCNTKLAEAQKENPEEAVKILDGLATQMTRWCQREQGISVEKPVFRDRLERFFKEGSFSEEELQNGFEEILDSAIQRDAEVEFLAELDAKPGLFLEKLKQLLIDEKVLKKT